MAEGKNHLTLTAEFDLLHDVLRELEAIQDGLVKKHGAPFRALERAIENLFESRESDVLVLVQWLPDGTGVVAPGSRITAILIEARRLGLTR